MLNINVAVKPGWAGGKWHTRQFEAALLAAGYTITDVLHADVIIAHSVACYDLKTKSPALYYYLIDPPYWPGKSIFKSLMEDHRAGRTPNNQPVDLKYAAKALFWKSAYILAKPKYTHASLKTHDSVSYLASFADKHVTLIRNQLDPYCSPDIQVALAAYPNVKYVDLPGAHDDYYTNPQPYIALLPKTL